MPDFDTWLDEMVGGTKLTGGDGDVQQQGVEGGGHLLSQVQRGGVQAQGGEVMGG